METRKPTELKVNPLNPRGEVLHDVALRELGMSIKAQGLLQPILITPDGTIVAGHRRVAAARLIDLTEVPVIVKELTESEQLQVMLVENLQRNDLTLFQTAKAYRELTSRGLSVELIAKAIGVTKRSVSEHLGVFRLPEKLWKYFDTGELTLRSVPCLLELSPEDQLRIGLHAVDKKWGTIKIASAIYREKHPNPTQVRDQTTLSRIWHRVQDGCYTPETVLRCGECERPMFDLTCEEIKGYLDALVADGRAECRKQGGKKDITKGQSITLYVPAGMPSGDGLTVARERSVWSEEAWQQ